MEKQSPFTDAEAKRLEGLRRSYPYYEFVDSRKQWNWLVFLRWLNRRGVFYDDGGKKPIESIEPPKIRTHIPISPQKR